LLYSSDTRGTRPFYPQIGERLFKTLEIPTTLPTFDELLGRPEFPDEKIVAHYLSLLRTDRPNILTLHAEIEGMGKRSLFHQLLSALKAEGVELFRLDQMARDLLKCASSIPNNHITLSSIEGRSGTLAVQN
jgi:hypothetical protein